MNDVAFTNTPSRPFRTMFFVHRDRLAHIIMLLMTTLYSKTKYGEWGP